MPADLPTHSLYTYAAEFSADEALQAGAARVTFSQPVVAYLDNFLSIPVGTYVPAASDDPTRTYWMGQPDARVIEVLGVTLGKADLDVTGGGVPSDAAALRSLSTSLRH
jgi:hypothetical protein